ncbi:hypothetical protein RHMOL_Rhmol13G0302000 [Rhododendron molle]|uniref:Uncharacterized protein n=1 Tax=Rhododendron molle TaxID=49168 RepID=A0ACC0LCR4_RHOML|nr:hypothetical protein RHMOL_Rhmol13G0302000 [Rhododendron molle]
MLLQITAFTSPFQSPIITSTSITKHYLNTDKSLNPSTHFLGTALFPSLGRGLYLGLGSRNRSRNSHVNRVNASLLEAPVLWVGRMCIFYALVKLGLAGSPETPLSPDSATGGDDLGFSKWVEEVQGKPEKEAPDNRKQVSKWRPTTKGTLKRNYRVPSISEGRRFLKSIASLLSDDDQFRDATSHKGCQIRRESAHGESVCCNNVSALFDELPTPHLLVEITPFPAGPLTENDYAKAEKLERLLRPGPSM